MTFRHAWIAWVLLLGLAATAPSDIFRWDNGQLIPGTEGITPHPGVMLYGRNLAFADLRQTDLTAANFGLANLTNAKLDGAIVTRATFGSTTQNGFTKEQLYSTANYKAKDLRGVTLSFSYFAGTTWRSPSNDLSGWNFSGQDLTDADLEGTKLTNADFSGAIVKGVKLGSTTYVGFTKEQLYSTVSYQIHDLQGVALSYNDLSHWDLTGQSLMFANLQGATLTSANFTGALISGANFSGLAPGGGGLTKEQLYSTASYKAGDLQKILLEGNDLTGWDFSGQDLAGASLAVSTLFEANLTGAIVAGADLAFTGMTKEQLYSTASYKAKYLHEIRLSGIGLQFERSNLSGWDFSGQDLSGAVLHGARLTNANLRGANLANASFEEAVVTGSDLTGADLRGAQGLRFTAGVVLQNTILPNGRVAGLDLAAGQSMLIRDDDELTIPPPRGFASPRPPIPVTILDHLAMADGSVLALRFEADAWDSLISFAPGIPVELDGTLELSFTDGVDAAEQVGRTLQIFDWTGVSPNGEFGIRSPYAWDTSLLYTTGEVTLIAVPEPRAAVLLLIGVAGVRHRRRKSPVLRR